MLIVPPEKAADAAEAIVERFDQEVPALYDPDDRERGYVEVGEPPRRAAAVPLLSISIGVASTEKRAYAHYAEAVAIATEMKSYTKATAGSSWAIDRRTT